MQLISSRLLVLAVIVLANLLLVSLVYRTDKKSATNIVFASLGLIISVWLLAIYFSVTPVADLFWTRVTIACATLMSMIFFLFAHTIPSKKILLSKIKLSVVFISTVIVMIIAMSPFAFTHVAIVNGMPKAIAGPGMAPFALVTTFFSVAAFYLLISKYRRSGGIERKQFQFILVGIILMLCLIIFTVMLPVMFFNNDSFVKFAPVYALIFLGMSAVSILKYHLFNIKIIATEALVVLLVITLFFEGLLSGSLITIMYKIFFAIVVAIIGALLVQSVQKEIRQREELSVLAKNLETANTRLTELDQQKTDFLSIAAHQLRTPMSIMNGYIELIKDNAYGKVTTETKEILANMDESNQHLIKLVDEFLDITRIEQGRTKFEFTNHDLSPIIDGVVEEMSAHAKERGLKVNWKNPKQPLAVDMDEEKIRHVVYNFLDNAIKYSESGVITITAQQGTPEPSTVASFYSSAPSTVEVGDRPGIIVKIKDEGLGFSKIDEANFFQKFYRGSNVKHINVNGTGLGLFVCRKFIEAHGGHIWAHSAGIGRGSEFGFWIPIKQQG